MSETDNPNDRGFCTSATCLEERFPHLAHKTSCPSCFKSVQVWADNSEGVTVNFACDNPECDSGKGPWDTPRPVRGE